MTYQELDQILGTVVESLVGLGYERQERAVSEARRRLALRAEEREAMSVVCRQCLKKGASVKLTLTDDKETFTCPVHGNVGS